MVRPCASQLRRLTIPVMNPRRLTRPSMNTFRQSVAVLLAIGWLAARTTLAAQGVLFQTSVAPQPDEDLASACRYELTLPDRSRPVRGVWVTFDRGRDMLRYYGDPDVQAFARRNDLALLLPFHCAAKSYGDMNVDPSRGIGRALFTALNQLAESSGHSELASAKLILLGFSGTGSLASRFPEFAPNRVLAVVSTNAGHFDPLGVDTITLSRTAAAIPQLILTGSSDAVSGTTRPYAYFRKYFDAGSPWTFVVQNNTPHCCVINAKALVLEWLDAVAVRGVTRRANTGSYGFIRTTPSAIEDCPNPRPVPVPPSCRSTLDNWGATNWSVAAAKTNRHHDPPEGMIPAGWLPTGKFAKDWLAFVRQPEHPVTSLP